MATSHFHTTQHTSTQYLESAGAILFRLPTHQICLLHLPPRNEYLLPKGRLNICESRQQAALREVREETGYPCRMLPVTMSCRAPPAVEVSTGTADVARVYEGCEEAFALQIRQLGEGGVKLIWWFVAVVEEGEGEEGGKGGEEQFEVGFYGYEEAVERVTF
ncbi:MAG: hypothetical protein Q9195_005926 [Heterodermia aff. obscurata]